MYAWYTGYIDSSKQSEALRRRIDAILQKEYTEGSFTAKLINAYVLGNRDKFVWRPSRIIPSYDYTGTKFLGYMVSGVVTGWEPRRNLLTISSYIGRTLYVRFDPTNDRSVGVFPPLNAYGAVGTEKVFPVVTVTGDNWDKLFCTSDIVNVFFRKRGDLIWSHQYKPIIPTSIMLTQRVCKP